MIVKSTVVVIFREKNRTVQKRESPVYSHSLESCMQYFEGFAYSRVTICADAIKLLKKIEIDILIEIDVGNTAFY